MGDLSFQTFARTVKSRAERWFPIDRWSGSDWATALAGETGEVCNVVKKLNRADVGAPSIKDPPRDELVHELGREIADVITYANILAQRYDVDVAEACVEKFNEVSLREGFPERLELLPDPPELVNRVSHPSDHDFTPVLDINDLRPPMSPPAATPDVLAAERHLRAVPRADAANQPRFGITRSARATSARNVLKKTLRKRLR